VKQLLNAAAQLSVLPALQFGHVTFASAAAAAALELRVVGLYCDD